jgi:hypothetical protein
MKKQILCFVCFIFSTGVLLSQKADNKFFDTPSKPFEISNSRQATDDIRGDFSIEISDELKVKTGIKFEFSKLYSLVLKGELGSTNDFNPILDDGKWALDLNIGASNHFSIYSSRWFFEDTIKAHMSDKLLAEDLAERQKFMKTMDDDDASQFALVWFTLGLNYNYKSHFLLNDSISTSLDLEDMYSENRKSNFLLTLKLNGKRAFSVRKGIMISGNIAWTFGFFNSNYNLLKKVKLYKSSSTIDSTGQTVTIKDKEVSLRKGVLKFSPGYTVSGALHFTFNSVSVDKKKRGVGVDFFYKPELHIREGDSPLFNSRVGINLAVLTKEAKSIVNIGFVVDFEKIGLPLDENEKYADRIIPGIILGIALPKISFKPK